MYSGLKTVLHESGALGAIRVLSRGDREVPVLRYHSISDGAGYASAGICVTPALFDRQMAHLARHYRMISLDELVRMIAAGEPFPARSVCITFDDGYLDNHTNALPILCKYGLTATFYITAGPVLHAERFWVAWLQDAVQALEDLAPLAAEFAIPRALWAVADSAARQRLVDHIGGLANRGSLAERAAVLARAEQAMPDVLKSATRPIMMGPAQLQDLVRRNMTIGSHSVTHPILANLSGDEALRELKESRALLEKEIGAPVVHFAYPNGAGVYRNFTEATCELARRAGYHSASTSVRGVASHASNPLSLPRQGANNRLGMAGFAVKLEEHRFRPFLRAR